MKEVRVWGWVVVVVGTLAIILSGTKDTFAQTPSPADTQQPAAQDEAGQTTVESKRDDESTQEERLRDQRKTEDAASIPPAEKRARVQRMLNGQRAARDRASTLYAEARSKKDMLQVNCVSDKLTQIKGLLRVSQRAEGAMANALESNKSDEANHSFNQISLAHQRSGQLRAEAEQCVGELSVFTGNTEVKVEIDPSISPLDPTQPVLPPPGPQTPPLASEVDGGFTGP